MCFFQTILFLYYIHFFRKGERDFLEQYKRFVFPDKRTWMRYSSHVSPLYNYCQIEVFIIFVMQI